MNTPSENDPAELAKQRLARSCRNLDRSTRLRWVLLVFEWVLLALLVLGLSDYWLVLPVGLRAVGALALGTLLLCGAVRLVTFLLRPTRLKQGALKLEALRPELGCEVSTAAEYLTGERELEHEYEAELAAALQAKTARHLADAPMPAGKMLVRFAILLGATVATLVILVLAAPGGLTALLRTAVPFSNAHYTTVQVQPGNVEVAVGKSVSITNIFSGRPPKDARITWTPKEVREWQTAALKMDSQGNYVHTLTNLQSDLVYRVAGSDAASEEYRISTYVPPAVKYFNIELNYPQYTRRAPLVQSVPNISVVRATSAKVRIQPTVPLKQASLTLTNGTEFVLSPAPDGSWVGTMPITKDTDYQVALVDAKGHLGVNEQPYHIQALPDNPPKVEISEPGKDIRSSSTNTVAIKISASDDFGVDQIKLVYNKLNGPPQTLEAKRVSEHNGEVVATADLDLSKVDLKEFELVAYHAEAIDNNTLDGPGVGKSPVYFIEITDLQSGESLSQGQSQKVNLLVIQKQIVADTTALAAAPPADTFKDLAVRQTDAAEFGRMYQDALAGAGEALNEMHLAITEMELASAQLEKQQRSEALPHEESALAHLYQVLKMMPDLGDLPVTTPPTAQKPPANPKVQVVLDAIKQKKKEQPNNKDVQDALEQAKALAQAQASLNNAMRQSGDPSEKGQDGKAAGQGKAQSAAQAMAQGQGEGQGKGQGQGQGQGEAQAKAEGRGKGEGQGKQGEQAENRDGKESPKQPGTDSQEQKPQSPSEIAQKEDQLSKEAADLAERLKRLGNQDKRVGHNVGNAAARASMKMAAAGKAMAQGTAAAAGEHGFQGELAMRNVVDQLERVVKNRPDPTDIAHEDAPKEYDTLISEYLKQLSHAE